MEALRPPVNALCGAFLLYSLLTDFASSIDDIQVHGLLVVWNGIR